MAIKIEIRNGECLEGATSIVVTAWERMRLPWAKPGIWRCLKPSDARAPAFTVGNDDINHPLPSSVWPCAGRHT
ncbi:MAG TPA: hypothetical protein QGG93_07770 [Verrucomicrobiota bacterium]|nr:hypothetical protein [Verrucomicrobiota bacterium]